MNWKKSSQHKHERGLQWSYIKWKGWNKGEPPSEKQKWGETSEFLSQEATNNNEMCEEY